MTAKEKRKVAAFCKQRMKQWCEQNPELAAQCIGWSFAFDRPIFADQKTAA